MNRQHLFKSFITLFSFILCVFSGMTALAKDKTALLFIPLDNRPVCFSYPVKVMEAAGYKIYTPPENLLATRTAPFPLKIKSKAPIFARTRFFSASAVLSRLHPPQWL